MYCAKVAATPVLAGRLLFFASTQLGPLCAPMSPAGPAQGQAAGVHPPCHELRQDGTLRGGIQGEMAMQEGGAQVTPLVKDCALALVSSHGQASE